MSEQLGGDPRFHEITHQMSELHAKKSADYGTEGNVLDNLRATSQFGIPPWVGCMLRANDKMTRVKNMATRGTLANESIEDSLIDIANYAVLALVLYREATRHDP